MAELCEWDGQRWFTPRKHERKYQPHDRYVDAVLLHEFDLQFPFIILHEVQFRFPRIAALEVHIGYTWGPMGLPPLGSASRISSLSSVPPSGALLVKIRGTEVRARRKET